jgi:hypothetical protein
VTGGCRKTPGPGPRTGSHEAVHCRHKIVGSPSHCCLPQITRYRHADEMLNMLQGHDIYQSDCDLSPEDRWCGLPVPQSESWQSAQCMTKLEIRFMKVLGAIAPASLESRLSLLISFIQASIFCWGTLSKRVPQLLNIIGVHLV